ncbi:MAG: VWA domain-containing protein [Deltaproteobacteria bacterium]|nr:VWA domain-containing protein [Deltaproteobacteria bacterium]
MLNNRDYTLILDKSGSMATKDQAGARSRWTTARESTEAFARRCEDLDPDGLTLYVFASRFRRYERVTADRVGAVFVENEPCGGTDLAGVLEHAFDSYFERKSGTAARPETILVITDGAPDDDKAVMRTILRASKRVQRQDELAVTFIQIGTDAGARRFLKILDEEMVRAGAPFDIISTVNLDEAEGVGLTEVLLGALVGRAA